MINVQSAPSEQKLVELEVFDWPIWEKEVSSFPWSYDIQETCYILEGEVTVTPENGEPVLIKAGDLVTFEAGLNCTWEVHQPIRKHYQFG
jgi:uncharacterized cupin superfamily protein